MSDETDFGTTLTTRTAAYLDNLTDCIEFLPKFLETYAAGEDTAKLLDAIEQAESKCDDHRRTITASIANADPQDIGLVNSRLNFNQSALVRFYKDLDIIADHTERIAQELTMTQLSPNGPPYEQFQEMAAILVKMADQLADLTKRFIESLTNPTAGEVLTDSIVTIHKYESQCDTLRNDAIRSAFSADVNQPLLYREFAILFDELANAIEELSDEVTEMSTEEPGIVTEPKPDTEN